VWPVIATAGGACPEGKSMNSLEAPMPANENAELMT